MTPDTYRFGQVRWALWQAFTARETAPASPPQAFETRMRRLLEIDREPDRFESETRHAAHAFHGEGPPGQGTDIAFSAADAFCLAIGIELLDSGFKQSEVVFLLRHLRADLVRQYRRIAALPLDPRVPEPARSLPQLPVRRDARGEWADPRLFLLFRQAEIERQPVRRRGRRPQGLVFDPEFVAGGDVLGRRLDALTWQGDRKRFVIEIGHLALDVRDFLAEAPLVKRGRS
ncbi:MAG: hypothetical protein AB7O45_04015 [Alphaproteobacteria bacterium]